MRKNLTAAVIAALVILGVSTPQPARADAVEDFFKGREITLIVAFGAGGGYDLYGRALIEHFGRFIPGNPKFTIQFMPGAGGALAANHLYTVSPKDGTVIGLLANGMPLGQVLRSPGIRFDAAQFVYIGRMASMETALMVWNDVGVRNVDQWRQKEVVFGSTGKANQDYFVPYIAGQVLGFKVKTVQGYKGSNEINLAMEKREVDAMSMSWASLLLRLPHWVTENKVTALAFNGLELPPEAPKVPLLINLTKNDDDRKLLELIANPAAIGRTFTLPPGTPPDRVAALRKAFDAMMKDEKFLADATARKMDVNYASGQEMAKVVERLLVTPPAVVERALGMM
jgi:tripartite-type tricarboxylate transporter receptor subunit TctC